MLPYGDWRCFTQSDTAEGFASPSFGSCSRGSLDAPRGTIFNFFSQAQYYSFAFWGDTGVQEVELVNCTEPAPPTAAPSARVWSGWGVGPLVQVLDGGSHRFPAASCVDPAVTEAHGERIATQCCSRPPEASTDPQEPSKDGPPPADESRCRRRFFGDDDASCVAGVPPQALTYAQAASLCESQGLVVCDISCAGRGCTYDDYPVWTSNFDACAAVPRPPRPPPPPPGPVALQLTGSNARPNEICVGEDEEQQRCFDVLAPRQGAASRSQPLVIDLHDASSDKAEQALISGWAELASRQDFVACFPNAIPVRGIPFLTQAQATVRAWNATHPYETASSRRPP